MRRTVRITGLEGLGAALGRLENDVPAAVATVVQAEAERLLEEARADLARQALAYRLTEHLVHPGK